MSGVTRSLCVCFLACCLTLSASEVVKAGLGDDVTLHCRGPRDADIELLQWTKLDLETDDYVIFFRDDHRYDDYQNPSFHGRVKFRDPRMTDGDASVFLKNVTKEDEGTYECYVGRSSYGRSKRSASEPSSSITLEVEDPSDQVHMKAKPGDTVVLPCQGSGEVSGVEWIRPDLRPAGHVFLSRDGRALPDQQHPYYKRWLGPTDPEMKDGDVSVILKQATVSDSGTYECYVTQRGRKRKIRSINLDVTPGSG